MLIPTRTVLNWLHLANWPYMANGVSSLNPAIAGFCTQPAHNGLWNSTTGCGIVKYFTMSELAYRLLSDSARN